MRAVRYTPNATHCIQRACDFYGTVDIELRRRALTTIVKALNMLADHPQMGRPCPENPIFRERIIAFGGSHFLALYRIDETDGTVVILALRHERELGYDLKEDI
jgi:plasmid stabilization system protein ParE